MNYRNIIIPIFLPQFGCPNKCVYCNQTETTLVDRIFTPEEVGSFLETELKRILENSTEINKKNIEIAFYGGSFTALPTKTQDEYLNVLLPFKKSNKINALRISTRPDALSQRIINKLKVFDPITIEIGAQSFNDAILKNLGRNHTSNDIFDAATLLKKNNISFGIHLMVNLPGETPEMSFESALKALSLQPNFVRIHPTLVFPNTILEEWYNNGSYKPWEKEILVDVLIDMIELFESQNIPIIRMGLQRAFKDGKPWNVIAGFDHPALREYVESRRLFKKIVMKLHPLYKRVIIQGQKNKNINVLLTVKPENFSKLIGYNKENKRLFSRVFPRFTFCYKSDPNIKDDIFNIEFLN